MFGNIWQLAHGGEYGHAQSCINVPDILAFYRKNGWEIPLQNTNNTVK